MRFGNFAYKYLKTVLQSKTLKDSSLTSVATLINGALGAFFYIYLARMLGPSDFGIFSVAIVTLTLVADITDFGTNSGIVNFVSKYVKVDSNKAYQFLKLALKIKIIVSIFVIVIGNFLASYLARSVFFKPELEFPLRLVFLGVAATHLFTFAICALQSYQKFLSWSFLQIFTNGLRLLSIFLASYLWSLNVVNSILIYLIYPFIGFLLVFVFIPNSFIKVKNENKRFGEFFAYNKWIASFAIIAALNSRLDTFITARLLDSMQVGIYSAANQLVQVVPQIVGAIGAVLAPKIAACKNKKDLTSYLKKVQVMVLGIAFLGLVSIPVAIYFIPVLFGSEYLPSINVFIILMISMLIFLVAVPIHQTVFYFFQYPKLFSWIAIVNLLINAILGWFMISSYGVVGGALTVLVVQCISFIIPAWWVLCKLKEK
ncbi:MAG: oligosaccharide flippase family protein [Patescibacteria group bacterium]|nr:oligosaccharide flippase family protein [Patescibacteria group bacterium]